MRPLITIGIGKRDVPDLVWALKANDVDYLIDVRTSPYSKYKPDFNLEPLKNALKRDGIRYDHWGESLGGFPSDPYVLTNGRVDYGKLAKRPNFVQALERLVSALENGFKIAILCSEGKPEECHRSKCIGAELDKWEVEVRHIDVNDRTATQQEVMDRLTKRQMALDGLATPLASRRKWGREDEEY